MLRVAYLVSRFPHLPETFILREMNELEAQGVEVELFPLVVQQQVLVHPEAVHWLERLHAARMLSAKCLGANLRTLLRRPGRYFGTFFRMTALNLRSPKFLLRALFIFPLAVEMAETMQALDVQHVHAHYATHPALAAWIIHRLSGIPYSMTVHAHDIFVNRTMLEQKLADASFVRAISQFNKDFLAQRYGAAVEEKMVVIHCGIDAQRYVVAREVPAQPYRMISVGSLQPYKGHENLVCACALLREQGLDFHCRIVGGGELQPALAAQIERLDLAGRVELAGPQTEDEVARLLGEADCFVLPSVITPSGKMEGIPVVLMEALAGGLPVVASRLSGIPELVRDHTSGLLVPSADAQALADAVLWMQAHPQEAAKMAAAGRKLVEAEFDIHKNTLELSNLFIQFTYQKVMAGEK
ncbi:MAG: colanic acid/amylovoran biosynthesis glycosyltransferase [Chloroflexota bacterium]|nr:colanic acid/amylovoran biosynthesis glycosyltransferase [Chloroflexota bacterium]